MTVFEHAVNEIREGIEIVEANSGTLADTDPIVLVALALCAVLVIACIVIYKIYR
jgi:hypothetical protein